MLHSVDGFGCSDSVAVVGEGKGSIATCGSCQLPAILPGHIPAGAVVIAGGVADGIVGDGQTVVSDQLVLPVVGTVGVSVGFPVLCGGEDIAYSVICVTVGIGTTRGAEQLPLLIVGVGHYRLVRGCISCDVAQGIVAVLEGLVQLRISQGGYLAGGGIILESAIQVAFVGGAVFDHTGLGIGVLAGNGAQPPQTVVAHGQHILVRHGDGVDAAVGTVVGIALGKYCAAHPPAAAGQLVLSLAQ